MANIKDFIKKIGNSAVSLEEQQQALAQVEQTIIEAKQKRTEAIGKNAEMVVQALKTIEAKLEAKLEELNNTPAKQGIQGPAGKPGKDGKDGLNGRDGVNGKDGKDGKDGVDGADGVSVVDAKIDFDGSLVIYLSNGSEIDAGQILSPDVAQNIIINSGGSGTSQTVTDTLVSLQNQINTLTGIDGVLGDMAQQNANAVAITGGTINGTTIGATTPAAGTFTTITGQTEVLRGTGTNLLLRSQAWATSPWFNSGLTSIANNTSDVTDPLGGNTATKIVATGSGSAVAQSVTVVASPQTASVYLRTLSGTATCDLIVYLSSSPFTNIGTLSVTITSSWQRFSLVTSTATAASYNLQVNNISASTIYGWGAQLEIGSTLRDYVATTTTAVYGTPTLSFSGVSTLGLEQTGALYLQPAGTGAIQAQATTSTTTGGNARGANAVDWSTIRGNASQVASGAYAVNCGGLSALNNSFGGVIGGGNNNTQNGAYGFIGAGESNTAQGTDAVLNGGKSNSSNGYFNVIGGGFTNSGTANAAVTTQSGTMNGTTAVTLSGSNANIKVGQYITGTSIASDTYVAAISGTSLTLSKNASGSSTSTLSFFTPHGVVVGGGNNQATGAYSFIGGGGDAGTAGNRNVASGAWSFVGGGMRNTASGLGAVVVGGGDGTSTYANTASGQGAFVGNGINVTATGLYTTAVGGALNSTSGQYGFIGGGYSNQANGGFSTVAGAFGNARSIVGNTVLSANFIPIAFASGVSQAALLVLAVQTTDATATALRSDANAAGTTNQVILPNNSAYYFTGEIVSGVTGGGNSKGWEISGLIKRGANAAATTLVGSTVTSLYADAGAATWTIALAADTTNGGLRVTFTGQAGTTIRTVCQIRTTEMTY